MSTTYIYPPLDANPADLYADFTAFMQDNIPGWVPYSGELDDWLARAFSAIAAQLTEISSDVATSIFRYFGAFIIGLPPFDATSATGTMTITVQDTVGYTIPAFTQVSFPDGAGTLQGFETIADAVVPVGSSTLSGVFIQAMTPGDDANGCSGSGDLDASTPITYITALTLDAPTSGGSEAEEDNAYLNRLTSEFTALTPTPVTASDFTTIVEGQDGVGRAITFPGLDPAGLVATGTLTNASPIVTGMTSGVPQTVPVGAAVTGTGIPANTFVTVISSTTSLTLSNAATVSATESLTFNYATNQGGHVTTFAVDSAGAVLSSPVKAAISSVVNNNLLANVIWNLEDPSYTTVNVTASVVAWPGQDATAMQTAIAAALSAYLSPATYGQSNTVTSQQTGTGWLNDNRVRVVVLENVVMNVIGVHYVSSLTINGGGDLSLTGIVPLPHPGTMTITVTNG